MNLRQLEAFRATIQSGSITGAAGVLRISQPSVSRLISDLEASVGFDLFARSGRGLAPTSEAQRFFQVVETTFVGIDRLRDTAELIRTTSGGLISIGSIQSIANIELPMAVNQFVKRYEDVRFMLQSRNTPSILDGVQSGQFDLGIVGRQPPYAGVEMLASVSAPYVCLLPEEHPLAEGYGPIDLEDLVDQETFVTFGGAFPDEMMEIDPSLSERMRNRSRLSATNMPLAAALTRETGALSMADPFSAEQAVRMGGVVFRPITQKLKYHVAVVCRARQQLDRQKLEFAELLGSRIEERAFAVEKYGQD